MAKTTKPNSGNVKGLAEGITEIHLSGGPTMSGCKQKASSHSGPTH